MSAAALVQAITHQRAARRRRWTVLAGLSASQTVLLGLVLAALPQRPGTPEPEPELTIAALAVQPAPEKAEPAPLVVEAPAPKPPIVEAPEPEPEPVCEAGRSCAPIVVDGFPFHHEGDTTTAESEIDVYGCASWMPESGGEVWYAVTLEEPGVLRAAIAEDPTDGVDVDVHLLEEAGADGCIARGNARVQRRLEAGTYWVVVDTCSAGGLAKPGPYALSVSMSPAR